VPQQPSNVVVVVIPGPGAPSVAPAEPEQQLPSGYGTIGLQPQAPDDELVGVPGTVRP
jgi:hypothetical protein